MALVGLALAGGAAAVRGQSALDGFDPNANGVVRVVVVQPDGKILIGGDFTTLSPNGGVAVTRNRIARLNPDGTLDTAFNPNASGTNCTIHAIGVQADGKVVVGGNFTSIGGQMRNNIARLDATTGLADSFNPHADNGVFAIAVQADGKILAGGAFFSIGGQQRAHIARLDAITGLADSFDPNAGNEVLSIAVQGDGKILVGGGFTTLAPNGGAAVTRNHIARLEIDGGLDQTLNLNTLGNFVAATAVQPDGKVLIGGFFASVLGVTRNNIARLNTDGTLDMAFDPNANRTVVSIALQPDGKILVGGEFFSKGGITIGGQPRNFIARLDGATGLADSFNPDPDFFVYAIAVQADGKILTGGYFSSIGGQMRSFIARLDPATGLADSFNPNANNNLFTIAVQPDGKILAGGNFNIIGGQPRNYIARLDGTTGSADSLDPNANAPVRSIAMQADGKILAGGSFTSIGGQMRNFIARLDPETGLADSFDPNASSGVVSIAVQPDGKILAGGSFSSIGGQPRRLFARLSNDTAALQNLAVTQTAIIWTRGGSSPQFTRVPFEYSTDNVNYTPLGNGTATGSNWTLTGLNLPTGQNFYIRARGYYRSGENNGSESITESVRNAFIPPPSCVSPPSGMVAWYPG